MGTGRHSPEVFRLLHDEEFSRNFWAKACLIAMYSVCGMGLAHSRISLAASLSACSRVLAWAALHATTKAAANALLARLASGSIEKSFASTDLRSASSLKLAENFAMVSIPA